MEALLSLKNDLNLAKIDSIWCLYKIKENTDIQRNIIIDIERIHEEIMYVYNILNELINISSKNNVYMEHIIIIINGIINNIEKKLKNTKDKIINNNDKKFEDTNIIIAYMESVIENGYIDFDKYEENKLFKDFIND